MRKLATTLLLLPILALGWFEFGQHSTSAEMLQRIEDHFDDRPGLQILILGNSRTYYHHMPQMLRSIADSAGSPAKYQITLQAPPGSSLESLCNDGYTQGLLAQKWDDAIIQGESRGQSNEKLKKSFMTYGEKLLDAIELRSGKPRLVENWAYDPVLYKDDADGRARANHIYEIATSHRILAQRTHARLIRVGKLWEEMRRKYRDIPFTQDGNHPSLAGSYLYALLLYADLSGHDIGNVTYAPAGVSGQLAGALKTSVSNFLACTANQLGSC